MHEYTPLPPLKNKFEYVHASQIFDDDNEGFVYGVNWLDENGEIDDCSWFKTMEERENAVNGMEGVK